MKNNFLKYLINNALALSRFYKRAIAISLDIFLCIFATWTALSIRLGELIILDFKFLFPALVSIGLAIPIFIFFGLYRVIFRYINGDTVIVLTKAISIYTLIYSIIFIIISIPTVPRSIGLMQPTIMFLLIGSSRWFVRVILSQNFSDLLTKVTKKEVIIYGAGNSGRQLASNLTHTNEYKLLYFVDDDKSYWGGTIDGYTVKPRLQLDDLNEREKPIELWLAMPNLSSIDKRNLLSNINKRSLHVRTLPSFSDLTNGRAHLSDLRELDINELLGRNSVKPVSSLLKKCVSSKIVLVTGAGGSIGSELCRQILINNPKYLLLVDNSELALYNIHTELISMIDKKFQDKEKKQTLNILIPLLVNIQDKTKLENIFKVWHPHTVYHAAAYKHVPMVEHNVVAGITNNVLGTLNCATFAMNYNVKNFVLVSTDKAVRPTNIMGASKRLAEMVLQMLSDKPNNNFTCFSMVRFGNVLGSSGSVVPLFRRQIESGGPITLTDDDVTRYFMTLTEAAQLVIQAGSMSKGGEVFVLDMGEPVRILDLAKNMIQSAGLQVKDAERPWGDIEIQIIGLRPGEKLYEELLIGNKPKPTKHSRIHQAHEKFFKKEQFESMMQKLKIYLKDNNIEKIKTLLQESVSGYQPNGEDVDWISKFRQNRKVNYNMPKKHLKDQKNA